MEHASDTADVIWSTLEAKHPHVSLTPLAAFFSLAALHHDAPLGYHTPPPLPPMVHHCRVPSVFGQGPISSFASAHSTIEAVQQAKATTVPLQGLTVYVELVNSMDDEACHLGVLLIRKLLCLNDNPHAAAVMKSGVVPQLIDIANRESTATRLLVEVLWALMNLTSSDVAECVALLPTVAPSFVRHAVTTTSCDVAEQAAQGIGNVAGDSVDLRDLMLTLGSAPALMSMMERMPHHVGVARQAVWAMSNLCIGKPSPPLTSVEMLIPTLRTQLHHADRDVVRDAAWALNHLCGSEPDRIEVGWPLFDELFALLTTAPDSSAIVPVVRILGKFAVTSLYTRELLRSGCLQQLRLLLMSPDPDIRSETCWAIARFAEGPPDVIERVIAAGLIPPLLLMVENDPVERVAKDAACAVTNVTISCSHEEVEDLLQVGILPAFVARLRSPLGTGFTAKLLEGVANVCKELGAACVEQLNDCGGMTVLEALTANHAVWEIRQLAASIFDSLHDD